MGCEVWGVKFVQYHNTWDACYTLEAACSAAAPGPEEGGGRFHSVCEVLPRSKRTDCRTAADAAAATGGKLKRQRSSSAGAAACDHHSDAADDATHAPEGSQLTAKNVAAPEELDAESIQRSCLTVSAPPHTTSPCADNYDCDCD